MVKRRHRRRRFNPSAGKIPWRRAWQPTPVFLPGESNGQGSLEGYGPLGRRVDNPMQEVYTTTCIYRDGTGAKVTSQGHIINE